MPTSFAVRRANLTIHCLEPSIYGRSKFLRTSTHRYLFPDSQGFSRATQSQSLNVFCFDALFGQPKYEPFSVHWEQHRFVRPPPTRPPCWRWRGKSLPWQGLKRCRPVILGGPLAPLDSSRSLLASWRQLIGTCTCLCKGGCRRLARIGCSWAAKLPSSHSCSLNFPSQKGWVITLRTTEENGLRHLHLASRQPCEEASAIERGGEHQLQGGAKWLGQRSETRNHPGIVIPKPLRGAGQMTLRKVPFKVA